MAALTYFVYTLLSGAQQGIITWLLREHVPPTRSEWVHVALHYFGVALYGVLVLAAELVSWWFVWGRVVVWPAALSLLVQAVLVRALVFDPSLNTSRSWYNHREGRPWGPLFEVGTVALSDRLIRGLAARLGWVPARLRTGLWLLTAALAAGWYAWLR